MPRLPFGPFTPDQADTDRNICPYSVNVVPIKTGKIPIRGPSAFSDAITDAPTGLWIANTDAGQFETFASDADKLYQLSGTSWTTLASGRTGPGEEGEAGVQFGTDFFWNNINDGLFSFDIEAGSSASAVGSSPMARHMDVVEEYLCVGNTSTSPRQLRWSDVNDGTTWSGGLSGSQTFPDGGAITAICGAALIVIQEQAVRQIIPTGNTDVFNFRKLEQAKGSISPQSVIRFGETVAYLAEDGFWWAGQPIGQGRVNSYFLNQINQDQLYAVIGRFDSQRPIFWWHYQTGSTGTDYDRALVYNWKDDEWGDVEMPVKWAAEGATSGYTLEQLGALYPDLDVDVPYSLDSRAWRGGRPVYAIFDSDKKLAFLEGDNLQATIDISERELAPGYRSRLLGARPLVDTTSATLAVRKRNRLGDSASFGSAISQQTSGICPMNAGGRYHRLRMVIPSGTTWKFAQGVDIVSSMVRRDGMR